MLGTLHLEKQLLPLRVRQKSMQLLWRLMKPYTLTKLLFDLKVIEKRPLQIAEDNAACIAQANNGIRHVRNAKHYEVKLAFLQQLVADEVIQFVYWPTSHQVGDVFTKPLAEDKFIRFRKSLIS